MKQKQLDSPLALWLTTRVNKKTNTDEWLQFISVYDQISIGIKAGYSLKIIHRHLVNVGKIRCQYDTFLRYNKKYKNLSKDRALVRYE